MKTQFAQLNLEALEGRIAPSVVWVRVTTPGSTTVRLVRTIVPDNPLPPTTHRPAAPKVSPPSSPVTKPPATVAPGVRTPSAFGTNPTPTPTPTPRPVPGPTPQGNKLTGSGSGLYICNLKYLNTPTGFHFNGSATITKLGSVQVQVDLFGVGFKTV